MFLKIFPLYFFLVLEKTNINLYFSKISKFQNLIIFINNKWLSIFYYYLKKEFISNTNTLIELSAVDNKKIKTIYYINHLYFFNLNITLFCNTNKIKINNISSIEFLFKNANWLERELTEMYGIFFLFKKDVRKLLLDYSKYENPLLKNFPCEGISDVYYNFFEHQINYLQNQVVEL